ncbi:hypothetical protein BRADI_4g07935v3 [Brachypodium distachyon]|uniref:Uncharacterized protein n=1 Tax=Brachypodium distachyon TaxID=15368 RepID=A0A0Q3EGH5_BRADI|nr:hypothetical protein BRADI_4g07935v3 [Brachypodium distachyon]
MVRHLSTLKIDLGAQLQWTWKRTQSADQAGTGNSELIDEYNVECKLQSTSKSQASKSTTTAKPSSLSLVNCCPAGCCRSVQLCYVPAAWLHLLFSA